jgi:GT2 family glycosyltransferase
MSTRVIWAIVATYNRRDTTVASLLSLLESARGRSQLNFIVVDDGSTDGTPDALEHLIPEVIVVRGSGSLYWAAAMAQAETRALACAADGDLLLWFNDDVVVFQDAITQLMSESAASSGIFVGATIDADTSELTYGALRRHGRHPLSLRRIPLGSAEAADSFNGNFVAMSVATARKLGGIDALFAHGMADIEYGLRARRLGVPIQQLPAAVGTCSRNEPILYPTRRAAWHAYRAVKGAGNASSTHRLLRASTRGTWPLWNASTIVLWWLRRLMPTKDRMWRS